MSEWLRAVRKTPDARPARVNRAKRLLSDATYPPRKVVRGVAAVLSPHLRGPEGK